MTDGPKTMSVTSTDPFGVYVHIPFCAHRCHYCDFATWTDREHLVTQYVDACVSDVHRHRAAGTPVATSVFFGGGTPSLIAAEELVRVLDAVERTADAEVTVECNPDSVDEQKLATYHSAGINRVSFGVQSMQPHVLDALGRTHDVDNVKRAVAMSRAAGFERVSVDLIYGAAGESVADWQATLEAAIALEVDHVSAYALTVEAGTPLDRRIETGELSAPDDDDQAEKYILADDMLRAAGFGWYEISNWARPGQACRHNLLYWEQGEYLGIGCAAHGHHWGIRSWNVRTPDRYIDAVEAGRSPVAGSESLDEVTRDDEKLTLTLRLRGGIDLRMAGLVGTAVDAQVQALVDGGLLTRSGDRAVLTLRGRLLANDVTTRLLALREGTTRLVTKTR